MYINLSYAEIGAIISGLQLHNSSDTPEWKLSVDLAGLVYLDMQEKYNNYDDLYRQWLFEFEILL